jgi:ABC-type transport system substrate-binding protein
LNFYVDERIDRGLTVAQHIAGKLATGGITTHLLTAGEREFTAPDYQQAMDLVLYVWSTDSSRPEITFYPFVLPSAVRCGTNPLLLHEPGLLELAKNARQEQSAVRRRQNYREIEYRLLAEPFLCPLYRPVTSIMVDKQLPGIKLTADGEIDIVAPMRWP